MYPEELDRFVMPHTVELSKTTVPIFRHASGIVDHHGSGVLLQVEGKRFLVTAAHVSDEFFCERWRQFFFGTPEGDDLIPVTTASFVRPKMPASLNRDDEPLDLAVLELKPDIADKLSAFTRFVTLGELGLDPDKLNSGLYLVLGYPAFRVENDEMDQIIEAQIMPYFTNLYDMVSNPVPNISPADHLVLEVNRLDEDEGSGDRIDLDQTHGISGCGVWRVLDEGQPIGSLDWRNAKLVAIVTDRSLPEVMGPIQYLRGTKIKRVINFIYEGWEDLRPAIEAAIPVRFVVSVVPSSVVYPIQVITVDQS